MTDLPLYLDTARAGLMAPRARAALEALHLFAGREGLSARFTDLFAGGFGVWPEDLQACYPGLTDWHGLDEFRHALRRLLGLPPGHGVLFAGRSAQLMKLAARLLFRRSERVLVTDLEWPGYVRLLEAERARAGSEMVRVPLRDAVLAGAGPEELVAALAAAYDRHRCDGLFLAAVGNLGVRLPIREVCRAAEAVRTPRFVVIDGAQAFAHTPDPPDPVLCDFYLAGCHKWLGAYQPLGLGVCLRTRSEGYVRATLGRMVELGEIDDPILRLTERDGGRGEGYGSETVAVAPLFSARAAAAQFEADGSAGGWADLLANVRVLTAAAAGTGWRPRTTDPALRSAILLLEAKQVQTWAVPADAVRRRFEDRAVILSAYDGGFVRVSAPRCPLTDGDLDRYQAALRECG